MQVMRPEDLRSFCKDFDIKISKTQLVKIYKIASPSLEPLDANMFIASLPYLGLEMAKNQVAEFKYRLREIKSVLEYPKSQVRE